MRCSALACAAACAVLGAAAPASAAVTPPGLEPAASLLLYERDTGTIVYAQDATVERPIASVTKLMTAYVTLRSEPANAVLTEQPYDPTTGESLADVPAGARLSLADMLRAMLLPSGNDVANSLAIDVGGSVPAFVEHMNDWAHALKLGDTHFTTPVGLDPPIAPAGNYSTAIDLAHLTAALQANPLFRSVVDEPSAELADGIVVHNRNDLVGEYPWVVGVKTGSTADAGYCLVAAARLHGVHLISVVLGAPSPAVQDADTLALLRFGLHAYRRVDIARRGQRFGTLPVEGRSVTVPLVAARASSFVVSSAVRVHASRVGVPGRLTGPLPAGTVAGRIEVRENGRVTVSVPLVTAVATPAPPPAAARAVHRRRAVLVLVGASGALTAALLGCSLLLMRRRARRNVSRMPR
jgi:D-alanyl-D-alanine carboxypeptidase